MSATKTLPMRLAPTAAARLRRRRRAAHEPAEDQDAAIDLRSPALVAAGPVSIAGSPSLARSLGPNAVLALQRTHGNRHVQRLLSRQEIKRCGTDAACRCAACSGQD